MVDYPHASAACLCYLGEREGEAQSGDAECLKFSLSLSLVSDCPPYSAGLLKLAKGESRKERVEAADELDTSKCCLG